MANLGNMGKGNGQEVRCGQKIEIPLCLNCGSQDLTVTRGLCGYCSVVTPEKLDKVKCKECEEFQAITEFPTVDGIVTRPVCFGCEAYWDNAYDEHLALLEAEKAGNFAFVN